MRVLVTGARGQLGADVLHELTRRGHDAMGVDIEEMDITDERAVAKTVQEASPQGVIHCAAWTAVDLAEDNQGAVFAVNAKGAENIAKACKPLGIKMLYVSTDYVFDGQGTKPWEPEDACHPLNVYGQSKREGELAVAKWLEKYFIVRIAWAFGANGANFVQTMLRLGKTRDRLTVVDDQFGTPTYTRDLARLLVDMIQSQAYGVYHATNEGGYVSWHGFAAEIFRQAARFDASYGRVVIAPVSSGAYPTKAKRPHNSRLCKQKLIDHGFSPLPTWQDALSRYLKEIEV